MFDCTFQFVAQRSAWNGVWMGSPEFQRKMPVTCQSPRAALSGPFRSWPSQRPRPTGSETSQLALTMWRTSKSELA